MEDITITQEGVNVKIEDEVHVDRVFYPRKIWFVMNLCLKVKQLKSAFLTPPFHLPP